MRYLIVPKGCSIVVRRSRIAVGVARVFMRFNASSSMERETTRMRTSCRGFGSGKLYSPLLRLHSLSRSRES